MYGKFESGGYLWTFNGDDDHYTIHDILMLLFSRHILINTVSTLKHPIVQAHYNIKLYIK